MNNLLELPGESWSTTLTRWSQRAYSLPLAGEPKQKDKALQALGLDSSLVFGYDAVNILSIPGAPPAVLGYTDIYNEDGQSIYEWACQRWSNTTVIPITTRGLHSGGGFRQRMCDCEYLDLGPTQAAQWAYEEIQLDVAGAATYDPPTIYCQAANAHAVFLACAALGLVLGKDVNWAMAWWNGVANFAPPPMPPWPWVPPPVYHQYTSLYNEYDMWVALASWVWPTPPPPPAPVKTEEGDIMGYLLRNGLIYSKEVKPVIAGGVPSSVWEAMDANGVLAVKKSNIAIVPDNLDSIFNMCPNIPYSGKQTAPFPPMVGRDWNRTQAPGKLGAPIGGTKHKDHEASLMLSKHLRAAGVSPFPYTSPFSTSDMTSGVRACGVLGNDKYGNCVVAAFIHALMFNAWLRGDQPVGNYMDFSVWPTTYQAVVAYFTCSGSPNPADFDWSVQNGYDTGLDPLEFLVWVYNNGIGPIKPLKETGGAFASTLDYGQEYQGGIAQYGCDYVSINVDQEMMNATNQNQPWNSTDPQWIGGHMVIHTYRDPVKYKCETWGEEQAGDFANFRATRTGSYVILTPADADSPVGASLRAYIETLGNLVPTIAAPAEVTSAAPTQP
jgi:hypothetical protein